MANKAIMENGKLTIELDEVTRRIVEKTFPFVSAMLLQSLSMSVTLILILVSAGKEEIAPYRKRIVAGENAEEVAKDLISHMGVPIDELLNKITKDVTFPEDEEIEKMLGWGTN